MNVFEKRRQELGISVAQLAKRSGTPLSSVNRLLTYGSGSIQVANILGFSVIIKSNKTVEELRVMEAERVARKIIDTVQEIMVVKFSPDTVKEVFQQTIDKLLTKNQNQLWS